MKEESDYHNFNLFLQISRDVSLTFLLKMAL